jgi:uncharacterized repeat protein (TIGR03803 family)
LARNDGASPRARLIIDPAGNLYGTALQGGSTACTKGCGTVFKLSPNGGNWTETTLYDFGGGTDGYAPAVRFLDYPIAAVTKTAGVPTFNDPCVHHFH